MHVTPILIPARCDPASRGTTAPGIPPSQVAHAIDADTFVHPTLARARARAYARIISPRPVPAWFVVGTSALHGAAYLLAGSLLSSLGVLQSWQTLCWSSTVVTVLGVGVHWLGHQRAAGPWHRLHVGGHHVASRPLRRFLSAEAGSESDEHSEPDERVGYLWLLPLSGWVAWASGCETSALGIGVATAWTGVVLKAADVLHHHFHLLDSPMERHEWFQWLRSLHWYHHARPSGRATNLAIADFGLEYLLGTATLKA